MNDRRAHHSRTKRMMLIAMDLQRDFLDANHGRLPIPAEDGNRVIATANLASSIATQAQMPVVFVTSHFLASDRMGSWFRRGAALANTPGAEIDPRVVVPPSATEFRKASADAFSNDAFVDHVREHGAADLVILGVFAEGCVRATVASALRRGFGVHVVVPGVASNARWKQQLALAAMKHRGAHLVDEPWLEAAAQRSAR